MKNKLFKMLSLFMAVVMITTVIPMGVYATDKDTTKDIQISEIEEAREIYSKTYETSKGTNVVISSAVPMHYEKDGEFVEIDNTLVKSEKDKSILTNKSRCYLF